jgi:hypothetical protein
MTVPGIGPLIASATVPAISNGVAFAKGRGESPRSGGLGGRRVGLRSQLNDDAVGPKA